MRRLVPQVQAVLASPGFPALGRRALRWSQLAGERRLQRPQRRNLAAQFALPAPDRRNVAAQAQIRIAQLVIQLKATRARPSTLRGSAGGDPPPHRPLADTELLRGVANSAGSKLTVPLSTHEVGDDARRRPRTQRGVGLTRLLASGVDGRPRRLDATPRRARQPAADDHRSRIDREKRPENPGSDGRESVERRSIDSGRQRRDLTGAAVTP